MTIEVRIDLYVHWDPVFREVAEATARLKSSNDALAQIVAQLGGQANTQAPSTTATTGDEK